MAQWLAKPPAGCTDFLSEDVFVWRSRAAAAYSAAFMHRAASLEDLQQHLAAAHVRGERAEVLDLSALRRVLEHTPEDMTVTVETGLTLAALQSQLARCGQWLPIDPPSPERLTLAELLDTDASGSRRFGYGTIREHLLGLKVVLADGRAIKNGGKVVKNVAGYDLCKLFVGARGTLGVIVEASFKLRPLPEAETVVSAPCSSLDAAMALVEAVLDSELTPVVLDLHNLSTPHTPRVTSLVLGFAGTHEDVDWQLAKAAALGVSEPSTLDHEKAFWGDDSRTVPHRRSVLPSRVGETLQELGAVPFVARAGNGVIFYRGGAVPPRAGVPMELIRRVKAAYDPKHVFPELPL